jgi:hypothetical protein
MTLSDRQCIVTPIDLDNTSFIVDNTFLNYHFNHNPTTVNPIIHHQTMENNAYHRSLQDFNEYIAQQDREHHHQHQHPLHQYHQHHDVVTNIGRSPIRTFDRAQSARNYVPPPPPTMTTITRNYTTTTHNNYNNNNNLLQGTVDGYDLASTTTMMLRMKNGSITPAAKRARSVSAPQINIPSNWLLSSYDNDENDDNQDDNDILDFLDMKDDIANDSNIQRSDTYVSVSQTQEDACAEYNNNNVKLSSSIPPMLPQTSTKTTTAMSHTPGTHPFYDYIDYSRDIDMTPDVPLTAMGRVPTFPAKLHAILLRKELHHIVSWLPHGRSWKVHDTIEFEKQVIAIYFEFTKHPNSSFFRQAKLWGFLRLKKNNCIDHDSYYHPKFLRGLPYLCKDVRRPPTSHLPDIPSIDREPDFTAISKIYPLPSNSNSFRIDPTVHLDWFMKGKQQQQQQHRNDHQHYLHPPQPPNQERMTKKTSSSTSTSTSYGDYSSLSTSNTTMVVKRKRSTQPCSNDHNNNDSIQLQQQQQPITAVSDHYNYNDTIDTVQPIIDINILNTYTINTTIVANNNINIDIDDDNDEERLDDDLGLNLDPYFTKGYHLYPFYNYIDHSTKHDMYPLQPFTEIGHLPTIPILLHAILLSSSSQSNNTSTTTELPFIMWQPHGRAFKICSPDKFESQILPQFGRFMSGSTYNNNSNHIMIQMFLRHLLRWGFKRITQIKSYDYDCYYHPKFLRGLPYLCKDWTMNNDNSTSSNIISSSTISSTDNSDDHNNNDNNNDTDDEYPEPDFIKISQLYPIPEYDPNITVEDLLGL